ncbi:MAG TPA: carboxypeptidase-like regulatory domain-containing protein [Myxococcota bacterium]|nr:carboxypeptidase-like regulatory domain-containing protein [Myxococcota bacterium]
MADVTQPSRGRPLAVLTALVGVLAALGVLATLFPAAEDGCAARHGRGGGGGTGTGAGPATARAPGAHGPHGPKPAALHGTVRDAATALGIAGARVWVAAPGWPDTSPAGDGGTAAGDAPAADALAETATDAAGDWRLDALAAGTLQVLAVAPGYARAARYVALAAGAEAGVDFVLGAGAPVRGVVVDSEGGPLAGVEVLAEAPPDPTAAVPPLPARALSDEGGRFSVEGLTRGATVDLRARRAGFLEVTVPGIVAPADGLRVTLDSIGRLFGTVFDAETGAPMPYAHVDVAGSGVWPPRVVVADGSGFYHALGLPEGVYELRATATTSDGAPRASPVTEGVTLGGEALEQGIDLAVEPAVAVLGRVVTAGGAPVRGARVVLGRGPLHLIADVAETDTDGGFGFVAVLPDRYYVDAWAPGFAEVHAREVVAPGAPGTDSLPTDAVPAGGVAAGADDGAAAVALPPWELVIALVAGAWLRGEVVDATDGLPIAGAEVEVHGGDEAGEVPFVASAGGTVERERVFRARAGIASGGGAPVGSFVTDAAGAFSVGGLAEGTVRVRARAPGYAAGWSAPARVALDGVAGVRVALSPGVTVTGRVRDDGHVPIEGAWVRLVARGGGGAILPGEGARGTDAVVVRTDAAGSFTAGGIAGWLRMTVRADGYVPAEIDLGTPAPGATVEHDVVLVGAGTTLHGRVVDERGFGVAGAEVSAVGVRAAATLHAAGLTDEYGEFNLAGVDDGALALAVRHPDFAPATLADVHGGPVEVRVVLQAGATLAGTVVENGTGRDVAHFTVELRPAGGAAASHPPERREFTGGAFRWPGLAVGDYALRVLAPPYAPAAGAAHVGPGATADVTLAFTLWEAGAIAGEVREAPSGTPLPGVRVAAYLAAGAAGPGRGAAAASAVTAADGGFILGGLAPADYVVVARDAEHEDAASAVVRVEAGTTTDFVTLKTRMRAAAPGPGE